MVVIMAVVIMAVSVADGMVLVMLKLVVTVWVKIITML